MCLAMHADQGLSLAGREIDRSKVLFLAGENPDDVRMRMIKQLAEMGIDPSACNVFWIAGAKDLSNREIRQLLTKECEEHGPFALIVVDTSAAFFMGDEENNNVQAGKHARMLRSLVGLLGGLSPD
jgi:RecA-family ATPase